MKKIILPCITSISISIAIGLWAATTPPLTQYELATNPTNWLSATSIRMTPQTWTLDPTNGKPLLTALVEAWGDDIDDGVTNKSVIRRQIFTLTPTQLANWNNAADGFAWLKNALLIRTKLTEKK